MSAGQPAAKLHAQMRPCIRLTTRIRGSFMPCSTNAAVFFFFLLFFLPSLHRHLTPWTVRGGVVTTNATTAAEQHPARFPRFGSRCLPPMLVGCQVALGFSNGVPKEF